MKKVTVMLLVMLFASVSHESIASKGVYQTPSVFLQTTLGETYQTKMLWLSKSEQTEVASILNHKFSKLRIRYWQNEHDTAWILNEVGKEKPITIGVYVCNDNGMQKIKKLKVLTFRESRGDEIRHDFFADQFINVGLTQSRQLSKNIDGITGATMSVRASTKVARLALWLNKKVMDSQ